jgi:hypothetical protein
MGKIMARLETGDRWWAAEIVLRAIGLALLGLCALSAIWLHAAVQRPSSELSLALETAEAAGTFLCWSMGGALLTVGQGLFRLIDVPGRAARFSQSHAQQSQGQKA